MDVGKMKEDGKKIDVHEERDGKLGTISESSKTLLDPRRGVADISFSPATSFIKTHLNGTTNCPSTTSLLPPPIGVESPFQFIAVW